MNPMNWIYLECLRDLLEQILAESRRQGTIMAKIDAALSTLTTDVAAIGATVSTLLTDVQALLASVTAGGVTDAQLGQIAAATSALEGAQAALADLDAKVKAAVTPAPAPGA